MAARETANGTHPLSRAELLARRERFLVRGGPFKADLWLARLDDGRRVVVKEFRRSPALLRWWGRLQVRRESGFLERLRGLPHVPRLLARHGPDGFVMSYVPGRSLFECAAGPAGRDALRQLERALGLIHAEGILHLDLRGRGNVRAQDSGAAVIVDWASAIHIPPGSLRHRLLFRPLRLVDLSALIKAKRILAPERVSQADREFERRFLFWRRLWPVNRKGLGRAAQRT